ncbi:MAG TPA: hypothetical protein PKE49_10180 [Leptospiraceae bacterium]|nr:hypothetical protein [Leptospiraceae bacterium]HMX56880.1 hypothetical protein [Leptospiraceae bacterium]HMY47004.1 hypothetical protein [Leptospiraceae bacterium]HNJ03637.1 hypothetical protein [Leptospiraceae bacterium]HNJ35365.1 hypothetical protein [Leptospiraceae bacterium]
MSALQNTMSWSARNFIFLLAIALALLVTCSPPQAICYIVNKYDKPVTAKVTFPSRHIFEIFRDAEFTLTDAKHEKYTGDRARSSADENKLILEITVPPHSAVAISNLGGHSYALNRHCSEILEKAPNSEEGDRSSYEHGCESLIYRAASLQVDTPDGTIQLRGLQIAMAFRRQEALAYVLELDPDLPEFTPKEPRLCCCL